MHIIVKNEAPLLKCFEILSSVERRKILTDTLKASVNPDFDSSNSNLSDLFGVCANLASRVRIERGDISDTQFLKNKLAEIVRTSSLDYIINFHSATNSPIHNASQVLRAPEYIVYKRASMLVDRLNLLDISLGKDSSERPLHVERVDDFYNQLKYIKDDYPRKKSLVDLYNRYKQGNLETDFAECLKSELNTFEYLLRRMTFNEFEKLLKPEALESDFIDSFWGP